MHFKIVLIFAAIFCCTTVTTAGQRRDQEVIDNNVSGESKSGEQPRMPQWLKPNVPVNQQSIVLNGEQLKDQQLIQQQLLDTRRTEQYSNDEENGTEASSAMQWQAPEWNQQGTADNNPWNDEQQQQLEQQLGPNGAALETQMAVEMMSVSRLRNIIQRGRDLMGQLPSMGVVVLGRLLNKVPTPTEVFHYSKKTLLGLPSEVISYVVDSVCKIGRNKCW